MIAAGRAWGRSGTLNIPGPRTKRERPGHPSMNIPAQAELGRGPSRVGTMLRADHPPPDSSLCGGGFYTVGGLFDQIGDSFRLGYIDGMATFGLDDRGTDPLRHGALRIRGNHPVLGGYQIPTGLRSPCRFGDLGVGSLYAPWHLGVGHEGCRDGVDLSYTRRGKFCLFERQVAILRRQYGGCIQ